MKYEYIKQLNKVVLGNANILGKILDVQRIGINFRGYTQKVEQHM